MRKYFVYVPLFSIFRLVFASLVTLLEAPYCICGLSMGLLHWLPVITIGWYERLLVRQLSLSGLPRRCN